MNFTFLIFYLFIYCIFLGNSEGKKNHKDFISFKNFFWQINTFIFSPIFASKTNQTIPDVHENKIERVFRFKLNCDSSRMRSQLGQLYWIKYSLRLAKPR